MTPRVYTPVSHFWASLLGAASQAGLCAERGNLLTPPGWDADHRWGVGEMRSRVG